MPDTPKTLPFSTANESEIAEALRQYQIGLTVEEARKVAELLGRDPTITEAVTWGIQGSEHCSYKSSRRFLKQFTTNGSHIILGPVEDSGVVAITDNTDGKRWGLVISHESHNHPSQIVPYEGAATGVGGTVRDVVCMGARVIGCMDLLRFGNLQTDDSKTIAHEVVRGIAGYGNPLGLPNLGGDTVFDATYNNNCLVNAIAVGLVREDEILHSYAPAEAGEAGYDILLVGKPTDRSGFGGAAFASASMEADKREQNTGAVQEPNPFLERHLLASCYALFDWLAAEGMLHRVSCKDLGAGGVVCASVEQVADQGLGADVSLDNVHVALDDLPSEVIGCAETQERLCFTCHPDLTERILQHFNETWDLPSVAENARASHIGKVTTDGMYRLRHRGQTVCEAKAVDITSGLQYCRPTTPRSTTYEEPKIQEVTGANFQFSISNFQFTPAEVFEAMLSHPNAASKEPVYRHYDKNVIGNTVLEAGEADAAIIAPLQDIDSYVHQGEHPGWQVPEADRWRGVAVAGDGNNRYGRISPYWQGVNAVVEAMRNVAAVGAIPRALTDCLNYGNPERSEQLWELEEGTRGIAEAAVGVQPEGEAVPIISGNVSLYNGQADGSSIDPTAIVSCVGILPDARRAVGMQLQQPHSTLYLLGKRRNECGGSLFYQILEEMSRAHKDSLLGANVPQPDFLTVTRQIQFLHQAILEEHVLASHDISDGGLPLTLFEMTLPQRKTGGNIGIDVSLPETMDMPLWQYLFSQTGGFVLEADPEHHDALTALAAQHDVDLTPIGHTSENATFTIRHNNRPVMEADLATLRQIWSKGLQNAWQI